MRDINPYAPPVASKRAGGPPGRVLWLRSTATVGLSCLVGAPIVAACAYALLELGLPPWTLRTDRVLPETIDLMAGAPLILNNSMASVICGALVWPSIWRHHVSIASAALVVVAVCGVAVLGAVAMKVLGDLYAIGGTEAVLLYEAIASSAIGLLLALGFSMRAKR